MPLSQMQKPPKSVPFFRRVAGTPSDRTRAVRAQAPTLLDHTLALLPQAALFVGHSVTQPMLCPLPSNPVTETASSQATLATAQTKNNALRPATLADALPLIPGIVRAKDGTARIAGFGEDHSALLVNSVDVIDPATGSFGLSVPIDSVQTIQVSMTVRTLTNHFNPLEVHSNLADPQYGTFFGNYDRKFLFDFDFLF